MNDLAPPPPRDMPAGRHDARRAHLLEEITTRRESPLYRLTASSGPLSGRRLLLGGLASAALAGGVTAALVLVPPGDRPPQMAQAGAVTVLNRAADAASAEPELRPRPDQYLYEEYKSWQSAAASAGMGAPGSEPADEAEHVRSWRSVDGKSASLVQSRRTARGAAPGWRVEWQCQDRETPGQRALRAGPGPRPTGCAGRPLVFRKELPTGTEAMLKWIYRNNEGDNPPDVQAFRTVGDTLRGRSVPPAARAALFRAAARIPGVTVRRGRIAGPHAPDLSAFPETVSVGQTWNGFRDELVFDARTHQLIGQASVVDFDTSFRPPGAGSSQAPSAETRRLYKQGAILYMQWTLRIAVTDRAGQAPGR
ncbi:CU044_5270 family protein [Spirillospora sp. NPDC127200]